VLGGKVRRFFCNSGLAVVFAWTATIADATQVTVQAPDALRENLQARSLAFEVAKDPEATSADILAAARADYGRLIGVLYAQAYYGPVIQILADGRDVSAMSPFDPIARLDQIELRVTPGARFVFSRAQVAPLATDTQLPEGFATGKPAQSDVIRKAAAAGVESWREAGHAKATVSGQRIVADHAKAALDAQITLSPGPLLRFGDLVQQGESRVRPERIRAIAGLPTGTVFSPQEIRKAADRLRGTGAFKSVSLAEGPAKPDATLDVEATIIDAKPRRYGLGAEVSSNDGVALSGFWMHRNLFGGAERFRFEADVAGLGGTTGGEDFRLAATLARPATLATDTTLNLLAEIEDLDEPEFMQTAVVVGASLTRLYSETFEASAGLLLQFSDVTDNLGERSFSHLFAPVSATWDKRDPNVSATSGFYLEGEVLPFIGLSGSGSGVRATGDARAYYALGRNDGMVAAARFQMGSVVGAGQAELPPALLFFSGGGGSVRGQPYKTLGGSTSDGETVGGLSFAGLSAEMRIAVTDKIGVVGFADAGFVTSGSAFGGNSGWHSGAGIGVRYDTGIGPIRFDVAVPTGGDTGSGTQFYIGIGQAF